MSEPEPTTGATIPALEVRNLAFAYPDGRQALFGCNLTVQAGERVAVLGPNGAGKTTLVLHLNGVHTAGAGEVVVGGLPVVRANLREIRRRVGIVFQDPDDQLFMPTVAYDVAFGPANMGLRGEDLALRMKEALTAVGMEGFADPDAASPELRPAPAGGGGDGVGHGAGDPGARRAVVEPRPGRPPGAGRDPWGRSC